MPISPNEPSAAAGDLNAALDTLSVEMDRSIKPVPDAEQQDFNAFYHS